MPKYHSNYRVVGPVGFEQARELQNHFRFGPTGVLWTRSYGGKPLYDAAYQQGELSRLMREISRATRKKFNRNMNEMLETHQEELLHPHVRNATNRSAAAPSPEPVTRQVNKTARASLSNEYSGGDPTNRLKGKGRSTSLKDINRPSYELQHFDPPSRRLSSTGGSNTRPRLGGGSVFSRFNNNNIGGAWYGASASRARGAVNIMKHPEAWTRRFMWYWGISEAMNAWENWRGYNKTSFGDTSSEIERVIGKKTVGETAMGFAGGGVKMLHNALSPLIKLGAMNPIANLILGNSEADVVEKLNTLEAYANWAGNGFKGQNPIDAYETASSNAMAKVDAALARTLNKVEEDFEKQILDGVVRTKDTLARRGVGGVRSTYAFVRPRPDVQQALDNLKVKARGDFDREGLYKTIMDNKLQDYK